MLKKLNWIWGLGGNLGGLAGGLAGGLKKANKKIRFNGRRSYGFFQTILWCLKREGKDRALASWEGT